MKRTSLILALAATAAMAAPTLALAQSYSDQSSYQQQQDAYQQRLQQYNQQRAAYDEQQRRRHDSQYGRGYNGQRNYYRENNEACRGSGDAVAGGLIGALAGAAIGSNLAEHGSRSEGAVLGAVAGGAIGASVGHNSAGCDDHGYYFSYNQTTRYQESGDYRGRSSGRYDYDYYNRHGCRLAVAPARYDGDEQARYVRVCPDGSGRYRLAD